MIIALCFLSKDAYSTEMSYSMSKVYTSMEDVEGLWAYLLSSERPSTRIICIDDAVDPYKGFLFRERMVPVKKRIVINKRVSNKKGDKVAVSDFMAGWPTATVQWGASTGTTMFVEEAEQTIVSQLDTSNLGLET